MGFSYDVPPFRFDGQNISFGDRISLLTLCLAPLLAHIAAGAPQPAILSHDEPKWHDLICHYNPVSILWRYIAITDRRIRARVWDQSTLAATNALFWTSRGWDGSEEMVTRALPYCTRLPQHTRLKLLSWETVKTLIVMLQGIQATVACFSNLNGPNGAAPGIDMETIFVPLSVWGLLRLPAALWLTDEHAFAMRKDISMDTPLPLISRASMDSLIEHDWNSDSAAHYFWPVSRWTSRLFLTCYILLLQCSLALMVIYSLPEHQTVTSLVAEAFYLFLLITSIPLFMFYFIRGRTTTTIIPCISTVWYKAYSIITISLMVALIVVAGVQTRRTPCGRYTTWPGAYGDKVECQTKDSLLLHVGDKPESTMLGLASRYPEESQDILGEGGFWIDNFTGSCMGTWSDIFRRRMSTVDILEVPGGKADYDGNGNETIWRNTAGFSCDLDEPGCS